MLIVLDNAESILDPRGPNAGEIYSTIEELSHLGNICLCITSRISAVPSCCKTFEIPTLSPEAACKTFYQIYKHGEQLDLVNDILEQLDFHPLSITLLATVAQQNKWDFDRLTREWERHRTAMLHTVHDKTLATTVELSLASAMFQKLGSDAGELLGVIAFLPQGVDENNLDWLFPTIPNSADIFDKFCILSLTYRSEGFVKMLAPLRDHLRPKNPLSSLLLRKTKDRYFSRLADSPDLEKPDFGDIQWLMSEDVNVEHLLDVFTSGDASSEGVWDVCAGFMARLRHHKPRHVMLGTNIEGLSDDHPSKPQCLLRLALLVGEVGNHMESKRLLADVLRLWKDRGDLHQVALTLRFLSDINRVVNCLEEGMELVKKALDIYKQLGDTARQAQCLSLLALLLLQDSQLDTAMETASSAITLLPENATPHIVYQCRWVLGRVYQSKGNREKAIEHLEVALEISSSRDWHSDAFWAHHPLVMMFSEEGKFDDASAHLERAKLHVVNNASNAAHGRWLQAYIWYHQGRFEEAESEVSHAMIVFEGLGNSMDAEACRMTIYQARAEMSKLLASDGSNSNGKR